MFSVDNIYLSTGVPTETANLSVFVSLLKFTQICEIKNGMSCNGQHSLLIL